MPPETLRSVAGEESAAEASRPPLQIVRTPARVPSLLESLLEMARLDPGRRLFTVVGDDGRSEESITAGELVRAAEALRAQFARWGIAPGDRVLLVYPSSIAFIQALVGCMAAGVVPVPVYPLDPFRLKRGLDVFTAIAESCGARAALTTSTYARMRTLGMVKGFISRDRASWPEMPWHATDGISPAAAPGAWAMPTDPDAVAFLQYTSGSTSTPRGVMITHGNLHHEMMANARDLGLGPDARAVLWVPLYHDLGLISGVCSSLGGNGLLTILSPLAFIARPQVWFEVMSRVRATHTAAPNFALELALRKTTPEQRRRWDLRSLRVLMSAAEPIRASTVRDFLDAFETCGLRRDAFYPAYGLAEATVSVTMGGRRTVTLDKARLEEGHAEIAPAGHDRPTTTLVGCGKVTKPDARVRIVDPQSRLPCEPGDVGEIWLDSSTKALGYYGLPDETEATFRARIADGDETPYLRTGDLGFFLDDELFIAGRCKDLIIVRGRNLYPQDVEDGVRTCHPLVRPGGVAGFAIGEAGDERSAEQLVLFVEAGDEGISRASAGEIAKAVRRSLRDAHQVQCDVVVVGKRGLVHKTTSGKVRRQACKQAFQSGQVQRSPLTLLVDELQAADA